MVESPNISMGDSVTVARGALTAPVQVRILVPQIEVATFAYLALDILLPKTICLVGNLPGKVCRW